MYPFTTKYHRSIMSKEYLLQNVFICYCLYQVPVVYAFIENKISKFDSIFSNKRSRILQSEIKPIGKSKDNSC
jgi:hypothetical protein